MAILRTIFALIKVSKIRLYLGRLFLQIVQNGFTGNGYTMSIQLLNNTDSFLNIDTDKNNVIPTYTAEEAKAKSNLL